MEAVGKAGFKGVCKVGMDVAALEFKVEGEDCYDLGTRYAEAGKKPDLKMTGAALADFYAGLCKGYPLIVALPALCGPRGERPAVDAAGAVLHVINGGSHAGSKLAFQEYLFIPVGAKTFKEAMQIGAECYHTLKGLIKEKFGGGATLIGDEGGVAPPPCDAKQGVELIMKAIGKAGFTDVCKVGMDVAASELKVEGEDCYDLGTRYAEAGKTPDLKMTGAALADFYAGSCKGYPLIAIEGPFDQAIGLVGWFHREGGPTQVFVSSAEEDDSAELEEEEQGVSPACRDARRLP